MDYEQASTLVGLLYGNILHRDSDPDGFQYHIDLLTNGEASLDQLVHKFFTSEEFTEKFVVNQTPNELVSNLLRSFLQPAEVKPQDHGRYRNLFIANGFGAAISTLLEDRRRNGHDDVPRYLESAA